MNAPNHLVGGFTFTGIFGSLLGINILSDQRLLPIILIACLLPDMNHTQVRSFWLYLEALFGDDDRNTLLYYERIMVCGGRP